MRDTDRVYRGYLTNDPAKASELFKRRFGYEPKMILVRPDMELVADDPRIVRSRFGAAGLILVAIEEESDA